MNKKVTIREAVNYVINSKGEKHTLLGIGPMSENFLRASLEISKEKDFPLMYIASRNQVDAYKFGGGYVFNSDQKLFKEKIEEIAQEINYDNVYYLCRDHGGPWQRDKERADHLPEDEAMAIAKESYKEDILNLEGDKGGKSIIKSSDKIKRPGWFLSAKGRPAGSFAATAPMPVLSDTGAA